MRGLLFVCCIVFFALPALAEDPLALGLKTNGCGAEQGWSSYFVPNKTLISHCEFKSSCDAHDMCYGRCLVGGDLFGNPTCNDESARRERRKVCDVALSQGIRQKNQDKNVCGMYASLYQWAVDKFAYNAFHGVASAEQSLAAFSKFLTYVEKNPEAFDSETVQKAFESATLSADANKDGFVVIFQSYIPLLQIEAYDKSTGKYAEFISIRGKK